MDSYGKYGIRPGRGTTPKGSSANDSTMTANTKAIEKKFAALLKAVGSEEKQLDGEDAIPAEGAEELSWEQVEQVHFSAEEILQDDATREMWLRGVQQDPSQFLSIKFSMQLQRQRDAGSEP